MINLEWLNDYIDIKDIDPKVLAEKITEAGVNVEKVISNNIENLVIGKVISCSKHPDSDHLHVCTVDNGSEKLQIVCGAPNVVEGIKVIVALVGCTLPGDITIKKSKIRGIESQGMICALSEIGLEEDTPANHEKGIYILDDNAPLGVNPLVYMNVLNVLYELDVHKHRNNDCYYHIGFAYEVGAIINKKVNMPVIDTHPISDNVKNYMNIRVETDKCSYYLGKMVKNVKIGESPDFIKNRLTSVGIRSINNVVDISNYVMLEFGQPLHFFDKDKLGDNICVREAYDNEEIVTLDGQNRILNVNDIVITDGSKSVCIAGVMGGLDTSITDDTKCIFIESAIFDPFNIRSTASRLNLKSEASIRYGKGLNYEYTEMAIERCCQLLEKYASATVLEGTVIYDNVNKEEKIVNFTTDEVNKLLGIVIDTCDMEYEINRLGFPYKLEGNSFTVTIPNRRLDIEANINDIAEEIGRLYGYDNLKSTLPRVDTKKGVYLDDVWYQKKVSSRLKSLGLNEVRTYTLVSPKMAEEFNYFNVQNILLPNPMSNDKSIIRSSLISSLLNVYDYNKARGVNDVCIYEISKTYDSSFNEDMKVSMLIKGNYMKNSALCQNISCDFYLLKGIFESVMNYMGFRNRYSYEAVNDIKGLHPYISCKIYLDKKFIGVIGRLHPLINKDEIYVCEFSLNSLIQNVKNIKYKAPSKYPNIVKDVSFVVNENVTSGEIESVIRKSGGRLLTDITVFDIYRGDNIGPLNKSIAYSLTFNNPDRTLTEKEVMEVFNKIIDDVEKNIGASLRSS